jgi:type IV secretory pathway TrbL component
MESFSLFGDAFGQVIDGGLANLLQFATFFAHSMVGLGVCMLAFAVMFNRHHMMGGAFKFAVMAGFYLLAIQNAQAIGEGLMIGAVSLGLEGGGSSANPEAFFQSPDTIFTMGFARAAEMFEMAGQVCHASMWGCMSNIDTWLPVYAGAWIVVSVFGLVAFMVLSTAILFKLAIMGGVLLLPLAMFPPTAQFGFMPIKAVIHFAVQMFILALITSVGTLVLGELQLGIDPGVSAVTPLLVGVMVFAGSVLGATRLAYSLTSGAMLSAGSLLGAPGGMAAAAGRSAAGHLDAPATGVAKAGVVMPAGRAMSAMVTAGRRNAEAAREFYKRP